MGQSVEKTLTARRFSPGRILISRGADALACQGIFDSIYYLQRHLSADWGDLVESDRRLNNRALRSGEERLMSSYRVTEDVTLWIITEWDRSQTTLLLPDEY